MFISGTVTDAMQRSQQLMWPLLLFVVNAEQLDTCEELVRAASLESTSIMQLVLVGTEEHQQLQSLVQETVTPRVHIFAPNGCRTPPLPPLTLHGANFTAERVAEAVNIAVEWSEPYVQNLLKGSLAQLETMNKEAERYRRQAEHQKIQSTLPVLPGGKPTEPQSAASPTVAPAAKAAPPAPVRHHGGTSLATASTAKGHIQHYVELSVHDKVEVVFQTDPSMTLAAVWDMAKKRGAEALLVPDDDATGTALTELVIVDPDSDVKRHIKTRGAAEEVLVSSLCAKSQIKAVFGPAKGVAQQSKTVVVCEGDVCRRIAAPSAVNSTPTTSSSPVARSEAGGSTTISVRCQLPDGSFFVASGLSPDTPLSEIRQRAEAHLGHSEFAIYNSYPPKRFTEENMSQPLRALGLDRNATVRITLASSLRDQTSTPAAASSASPSQGTPSGGFPTQLGAIPGMGRLADMWRNIAGGPTGAQPQPGSSGPQTQSSTNRPPSSGSSNPRFATLSSLQKKDEENTNDKKPNHFFNGGSTEFEGK